MHPPGWKARFFTIWTGQTFSLVGSALVQFALIWWLTETAGSATALATASLVGLLPPVVLGPFVGTLVDRWRRRWVMVVADGAIALFTGVLALLYWQDIVEPWHVYVLLLLRALGGAFHGPAMTASTSLMVPKEHLTRVAGMNQTRWSITQMGGPVLGALLVTLLPIQGVLAIDILTALLAIVPLLFVDVPQPVAATSQATGGRRAVIHETIEGVRYFWRWRGLFVLTVTIALIPFFGMPAVSLVPLLVREHFGGGPVEWGWYSAADQIGTLVAGILMSTWCGFRRRFVTMLAAALVFGSVSLVQGLSPANAYWLFLAATLVAGSAASMYFGAQRAIMQATVPPEMQGRVFSMQNSLFWAMGPLGLAAISPLADVTGVQSPFAMRGAVSLLVALIWALTPAVRNLEDRSPGQDGVSLFQEIYSKEPPP
jgi:DHA3 family macrolide efflux protein-like MFS transporter